MNTAQFWNKLKELRTIKEVCQDDIALVLGISSPSYDQIESGLNMALPTYEQIAAIARMLDVVPETLYGADAFIADRFTEEEMELMNNPKSTQYIRSALERMKDDEKYAIIAPYQDLLDTSLLNKIIAEYIAKNYTHYSYRIQ